MNYQRIEDGATAVLPSWTVEAAVAKRDAMLAAVDAASQALADGGVSEYVDLQCRRDCNRVDRGPALRERRKGGLLHRIEADIWQEFILRAGLWSFMDKTARDEWRKAMEDFTFPELTAGNVTATMDAIYQARPSMIARSVAALFNALSIEHKTNSRRAFTARIIMASYSHASTWGGKVRLATWQADSLADLLRVLHVIHGNSEPGYNHPASEKVRQYTDHLPGEWVDVESLESGEPRLWFRIKVFKNGSVHVEIPKGDLDNLNRILSVAETGAAVKLFGDRSSSWRKDVRSA